MAQPVQLIGAGDPLGWSSFCEPYEWQFTGRAVEPSEALFFKAADIRERCAADYHFGYEFTKRITRMMLQRLQNTRNRMWEASAARASPFRRVILRLGRCFGRSGADTWSCAGRAWF